MSTNIKVIFPIAILILLIANTLTCFGKDKPMDENFFIQKNKAEIDILFSQLKKFEVGSTKIETVKSRFGPAFSEVSNFGPKGKRGEKSGTILTYYILKKDKDLVNSKKDEYIKLVFGIDGVLTNIIISSQAKR